jgi:spore coat polysaccharide biosynthesis protein SpsF
MNLFAFVQARLGSSRLPRKVLSKLPWSSGESKSLLEHIHSRLCLLLNPEQIVFLIPDEESDSELVAFLESKKWNYFRGSLDDVRDRFYQAGLHYKADVILRLTGDNPFIDVPAVESILEAWNYSSVHKIPMDLCYASPLPIGMGIESFSFSALEVGCSDANFQEKHHLEHVSLHIKENPDQFKIVKIPTGLESQNLQNIRMTIDETVDFKTLENIGKTFLNSDLSKDRSNLSLDDLNAESILQMHSKNSDLFLKNCAVEQVRFPLPPHPPKIPFHISILAGEPEQFGTGHWERCRILAVHLAVNGFGVELGKWKPISNEMNSIDSKMPFTDSLKVNSNTNLVLFDARDYQIQSGAPVLYLDNNLFVNSNDEHSLEILPNTKSNRWFVHKEFIASSRLDKDLISRQSMSNHFPLEKPESNVNEVEISKILLYTGDIDSISIKNLELAIDMVYPGASVIQVGKNSCSLGMHFNRLPKKIWYEMMRESDCVISYFGQTVLEACILNKRVVTYSISDYHESLSKLLETNLKIPYWGNPSVISSWMDSKKDKASNSMKISGNATAAVLKKIKNIFTTSIFLAVFFSLFLVNNYFTSNLYANPNEYKKLEELSPDVRVSVLSLGRDVINFIRWRNLKIAKIKLTQLEKVHSKNEEFFYLRSAISFSERRFEESIKDLLMALEIHPGHDPALFLMGVNYAQLRNWEKSAEYFVQSVRYAPFSPYYQLNCAYAYYLLGDIGNARKHLEISLEQKPNFDNAIILSQHIGDTHWKESFEKIRFISNDTKNYLENGFPSQQAKEDYILIRIYTFYPILK